MQDCIKCDSTNKVAYDGGRMGIYDGVVALRCLDCKHSYPRDDSKWALEVFKKFEEKMNGNDDN